LVQQRFSFKASQMSVTSVQGTTEHLNSFSALPTTRHTLVSIVAAQISLAAS
jgi:hypothetical protein